MGNSNHFFDVCEWLGITQPPHVYTDLLDTSDPGDVALKKGLHGIAWGEVRAIKYGPPNKSARARARSRREAGAIEDGPPDMLHAGRRGSIFLRHTRPTITAGAHYVSDALARAYPSVSREKRIMFLLCYHPLDDHFWRMVYALIVGGGPVLRGEMVRMVYRLSRRDLADDEAHRLYAGWLSHFSVHAGTEGE